MTPKLTRTPSSLPRSSHTLKTRALPIDLGRAGYPLTPTDCKRTSQLFSILAYVAEDGLFLTEDRSLAFGFICQPLSGADPSVADRVNVLLNQDWPVDTLV